MTTELKRREREAKAKLEKLMQGMWFHAYSCMCVFVYGHRHSITTATCGPVCLVLAEKARAPARI